MATFTIAQILGKADAYFIPNANGCNTDLTPVGRAYNWKCVDDPVETPNDNTDYVYTKEINLRHDLYKLPNHTTEAGVINYVQVFARTKSHEFAQHIDGIHKIILTDNACTNIYKSNDINLITGYTTYNNYWVKNPRTYVAWTWADIDNLQVGTESSSPLLNATKTLVIRPSANGDFIQFAIRGHCTACWNCVNEAKKDNFTSFVEMRGNPKTDHDLYQLTNHTTETGIITNVTVFTYVYSSFNQQWAKAMIKTQGTEYTGNQHDIIPGFWNLVSTNYTNNPNTGVAWTWTDIDNLQAGEELHSENEHAVQCTQLYVVVTYEDEAISPEIRTTQVCAKVNYEALKVCTLNKPKEISVEDSRNIKMLNFWSGNREVYDLSRNKKSIVLVGSEYQSDSCERITCMRNMGKNRKTITISGLRTLFNGDYKIRSFGWIHVSQKPECYDWILELEYDD